MSNPARNGHRVSIPSAILVVVVLALFLLQPVALSAAPPISIRVNGFWRLDVGVTELTGGAGSDFPTTFVSDVDQITITISKSQTQTSPWRLDVKRADTNWHANLSLYVKRTPGGTGDIPGGATVTGGTTPQLIGTTDQSLCTGTGDWSKLPFEYSLEGMSASIPVDVYDTTIYYTVTET